LRRPDLFLAAGRLTETNVSLLAALRSTGLAADWLSPDVIARRLAPGDTVLSRLDVRPTLDGVETGIWDLRRAQRSGVVVLNDALSLLRSHDKLATAIALADARLPHPRTAQVGEPGGEPPLPLPVVLKPRFGSWGRDIFLCRSRAEYDRCLRAVRDRAWFRAHGVLVQELVPPQGYDLRVVVACGRVVGAVERHAADDEWRTNVALGARRRPAAPSVEAVELALAAASAVGGDVVGIDLLPCTDGGYAVIEVNGAVDFTCDYSLRGGDVFADVADALAATVCRQPAAVAATALARAEPALALSSLDRVHSYAKQTPTVYLPSHDPDAARRLMAREVVGRAGAPGILAGMSR
jgi:RimK family alpha-L-glutamate ligase